MFGLSIGKILLVLAVAAIAWLAFRRFGATAAARAPAADPTPEPPAAEDLVECRVCGVYVQAAGAIPCGRGNCPQR